MVSRAAVVKGIPGTRYMMALMIITSPLTLKGQSSWMSIAEKATTNPQKAVAVGVGFGMVCFRTLWGGTL